MLSLIESGKATPSLETADFLAKVLDVPLSYLFSEEDNLSFFAKQKKIDYIKDLFRKKNYSHCIKTISEIEGDDDELNYIWAVCAYQLGIKSVMQGALQSAHKHFITSEEKAQKTIYDTTMLKITIPMYMAVIGNIQSPLLEFDPETFDKAYINSAEYEFFKYLTQDLEFDFKTEIYKDHIEAKKHLKKYNYPKAIEILLSLEKYKSSDEYNAFVMFGAYTDLEASYKQMGDFENAYRYANKRLSLLNAFQS
jgi:DNA-binding XRE family transcriptional regulator